MKTKHINSHQWLLIAAIVLFIASLFALSSCTKETAPQQVHEAHPILGTWHIDTIIVNAPRLSYDELLLISDTLTIVPGIVTYADGTQQQLLAKDNWVFFSEPSEYRPGRALMSQVTANRMVLDTDEKHRRIRRILKRI